MQITGVPPPIMRTPAATLAVLAIVLTGSVPLALQPGQDAGTSGTIRGAVTDGSAAVLPGVTVVAITADRRVVATAVTDGAGVYVLTGLPAGSVTLGFQLEGFAEASADVVVQPGQEARVAQRLSLAPLSETVVVHAPAPVDLLRPRFDPPPPLVARPLPEHDRAAVCGPAKPDPFPESLGTIKSQRHERQGELYLEGAELVINGGLDDGLLVGRNLVVRRHYHVHAANGADILAEHSAGVVQIVAATAHSSVGLVIYACDAMRKGDFLASFKPEPARDPDPIGAPAYYDAARILFADDGQSLGAPLRMMVIDRGAVHGVRAGQRFTLFRQPAGASRRTQAGQAVVVSVRNDSATIRIEQVTDAVAAGDWAAPQLAPRTARAQP
jgi:Carboxypeptidase regulatory-like domain